MDDKFAEGPILMEAGNNVGEERGEAHALKVECFTLRRPHAIRGHDPPDWKTGESLQSVTHEETMRRRDGELRPTAGFEDVKTVATAVMNHRVILNYKARFDHMDTVSLLKDLISKVNEAEVDLPGDVEIKDVPV